MENFKVIIVEDVPLELKGTEGIFKNDIPEAEIIGTADSEIAYWKLIKQQKPDLVLLDLGLGGSTTVGVEICRNTKEQIVERFKKSVSSQLMRQEALVNYEIDEYDERFLRHLALGYTKEQITNLRGMPFGVKSLEKRQNELVQKLFPDGNNGMSVNATRLVVRACELRIIDIDNLKPDEE